MENQKEGCGHCFSLLIASEYICMSSSILFINDTGNILNQTLGKEACLVNNSMICKFVLGNKIIFNTNGFCDKKPNFKKRRCFCEKLSGQCFVFSYSFISKETDF
ncbi:hypothetical protein ATANTOWER_027082 [Ataeniobius toweri]|uniref:Uncharacterized protein n=1 Tax=Ataeniobius toweri TaxID=208326 RepID=A0ABU7CL36_9TELE|nr:hypothetical protein [Ataeniobius toweri]